MTPISWPSIQILRAKNSGSRKTYVYAKNTYDTKFQLLINKRENTGFKYLHDSKTFIEYSNVMNDIWKNIEEYNPNEKRRILIVFDGMIADMLSKKTLNPKVTESFISGRKLNISLLFISQSYIVVSENIRLNSTHYFIMEILNK